MSPKKPAAPKRPRRKRGGRWGRFLALVVFGGILAFVLFLLARQYHTRLIREEVEALLGPLDSGSVTYQVADEKAADALFEKLAKVEKKSFGVFEVTGRKRVKGRIRALLVLGDRRIPVEIFWKLFVPPPPPPPPPKPPPKKKPRLALVIDDMGDDLGRAKEFFSLSIPVSAAIIPFRPHSAEVARLAEKMRRVHLLHMPMEPKDNHVAGQGQGMIPADASAAEAARLLDAALASVPNAAGINNHMGSRATESPKLMEGVMRHLARKGLFFLDSMTSPASVGGEKAAEARIPWGARDVFLDNENDAAALDRQIAQAVAVALRKGHAVAIGHDRPATLAALKRWERRFEKEGVEIVPVDALLR